MPFPHRTALLIDEDESFIGSLRLSLSLSSAELPPVSMSPPLLSLFTARRRFKLTWYAFEQVHGLVRRPNMEPQEAQH